MKTLLLKHRILSLFVLFVLAISLNGCSDNNDITTFLESQANTTWKFTETTTGIILYARINNDETDPFEFWLSQADVGCFVYDSIADDGTVEILENTKNRLVIKVVENAQKYSTITLTIVGDILTAVSEEFENDISIEKDIFVMKKTLDDVDGLEICAIPV